MKKILVTALAGLVLPAAALAADARTAFTLQAVQDLRERARYPEWSRLVNMGDDDPLLATRQAQRASLGGPQGAAPRLTVWASTISAEAGQSVDFYARLEALAQDTHRLTDIVKSQQQTLAAQLTAKVEGEHSGLLAELVYADDGRGADRLANDGIYSTRLVLPAARAPAPGAAESLMVTVHALSAAGDDRRAVTGVLFSNPGAHLTGNYRESIRGGNLVIAAEAEVLAAGRYHLSGTLADLRGIPVVSGQAARQLPAGKQWIELAFYGLAFHDRKVIGPVTLASISLSGANGMPTALGPVLRNSFTTLPLNLVTLTAKPFNDANMMETARRLEASLLK